MLICYLDHSRILNKKGDYFVDDSNIFLQANSNHVALIKEWKREMESKRDQTRKFLISGEDPSDLTDHELQVEVVTSEIPTSPVKIQNTTIPPIIAALTTALPTKSDIVKQFTLNKQQAFAFMIIGSHLDGDNDGEQGTYICLLSFITINSSSIIQALSVDNF